MTEVENLVDLTRRLLGGELAPRQFVVAYRESFSQNRGSDPFELWEAFEDLAYAATDYVERDDLRDPGDIDEATLRSRAQATYDVATDIIRRRGLHNIR